MRAILSVYDKEGIVDFAKGLEALGVEILSSGGTYSLLKENGVKAIEVSEITQFPEILDGRVKTLHPKIHGGILANRKMKSHMETLKDHGIKPVDIVVVNLYPFTKVISGEHTFEDAIENIDIGGPTMIRAAAKNHQDVLVVTSKDDYQDVIQKLKDNAVSSSFRLELALKAFQLTGSYDAAIATYLAQKADTDEMPDKVLFALEKKQDMRYGENPHQKASYYSTGYNDPKGVDSATILHGKELSYNNYNDTQGAIDLALEFDRPVCVAVKHATPCGVAVADTVLDAYTKAHDADPKSIFGGIVCFNRTVDKATAEEMHKIFLEVVIAPEFEAGALQVLQQKKNIRLLKLPALAQQGSRDLVEYKRVGGGFLAQATNTKVFAGENKVVTKTQPTKEQMDDLEFAMTVVKHVKSNAIVVAKDNIAHGIGGGEVNRIWAAEAALERAGDNAKGAVLASDAYFPFSDVVELAATKGIAAIIQPGGSIRDEDSIKECDANNISMVFTSMRHFRH